MISSIRLPTADWELRFDGCAYPLHGHGSDDWCINICCADIAEKFVKLFCDPNQLVIYTVTEYLDS